MNRLISLFQLLFVLSFFQSCTLDVDFDNEDSRGYLSVTANGNNADGSVSEDGYLDLQISGEDDDGVDSIQIRIPSLDVDFYTRNNADTDYWDIDQTFKVNEIDQNEPTVIYVTLVDRNGNLYERTIRFSVR